MECRFASLGCKEVMGFCDLAQHEASCDWSLVDCPKCGNSLILQDLNEHKESKCSMRIAHCPNLKCGKSMPVCLLSSHQTQCDFGKTKCPHCFKEVNRKNLEEHVRNKCLETFVNCPYSQCGCCEQILRKKLTAHLDSSTKFHLQLVLKTVNKQQGQIENLTTELSALRKQKNSFVDIVQDTADSLVDTITKKPGVPSWLSKWEKCDFNLMYVWVAVFFFMQYLLMWSLIQGEYVHSGCYMSIVIYGVFMGYYYFIHTVSDVPWYVKLGVSCYFLFAWIILSTLLM